MGKGSLTSSISHQQTCRIISKHEDNDILLHFFLPIILNINLNLILLEKTGINGSQYFSPGTEHCFDNPNDSRFVEDQVRYIN
jgi:hypothetical protein